MTASDEGIAALIRDCLATTVEDDGVLFDAESVEATPIRIEATYDGVRAQFRGKLGNAELAMQVDVGFGDVVTPGPTTITYPTLLDHPAPELFAYTPETSIAEKLEAMVTLDIANSRMKDFFDVALLARTRRFEGSVLSRAIEATFRRRGTLLPSTTPLALTPQFSEDGTKEKQWRAFVRKTRANDESSLAETVLRIGAFVRPVLDALRAEMLFEMRWEPGGPWTRS